MNKKEDINNVLFISDKVALIKRIKNEIFIIVSLIGAIGVAFGVGLGVIITEDSLLWSLLYMLGLLVVGVLLMKRLNVIVKRYYKTSVLIYKTISDDKINNTMKGW